MRRNSILAFLALAVLSCGTIQSNEPVKVEAPVVVPVEVNKWDCEVEIGSVFALPEDGKMVKPSTLLLWKAEDRLVMARGSGTVIAKNDDMMLILTAKHVIFGAREFWVELNHVPYSGFDPVYSERSDVALFFVKSVALSKVVGVAPIAPKVPNVGTQLDVIGNALGRGKRWMTPGVVATALPEVIEGEPLWHGSYHSYPGCSGAGVWANGEIVGVVSRVLVDRISGGAIVIADYGLFVGAEAIQELLRK